VYKCREKDERAWQAGGGFEVVLGGCGGVWPTSFDIHGVFDCDPCHDTCSLREAAHGDQ